MQFTTFFKFSIFFTFWLLSTGFASAETNAQLAFYKFGGDNIGDRVNLDVSAYIFHDVNRNGVYDLGDRSMADIVVAVGKGDTAVAAIRSNANGFANFPTSAHLEDASIKEIGTYEFVVVPPPGTKITTGNALQVIEVIEVPDTDQVLGAVRMPNPIGIAPYTFVRGSFAGELPAEVTLIEDGEVVKTARVQTDGQFLIPAEPGNYSVKISEFERPADVISSPVDIGLIQNTSIETDAATKIDFEGIAPLGLQKVPNGYGGLGWFNINAMSSQMTPGAIGYQNGATSGTTIAYTSSGHPADIYLEGGFDLLEVNLTISWPNGEGEEVKFDYYRGDELVATDVVGLSAYGPISYQPMIEDVTRVSITSLHYWQVIMDDLKVVID